MIKEIQKLYNKNETGYIGETYVIHQLARFKMYAIMCPTYFDYDILTENGLRLEVKTSRITYRRKRSKKKNYTDGYWAFANQKREYEKMFYQNRRIFTQVRFSKRNRDCDFFIFVCTDKDYNILKSYVIPKGIIGEREVITIPESSDNYLTEYYEKWDLVVGDKTDGV